MSRRLHRIILVLLAFILPGSYCLAQDDPLHRSLALEFKDVRIDSALSQISHREDVHFSYNPNFIPVERRISVQSGATVQEVLDKILDGEPVTYEVISDQIVLKRDTTLLKPKAPVTTLSLRGKVTEAGTGDPLPYIHVNLAGTMKGTYTNPEGYFEIPGLKPGKYEVMLSCIGFQAKNQDFIVAPGKPNYMPVTLEQFVYELEEVVVMGMGVNEWNKHYRQFLDLFFGHTRNSRKCRILNPEVLMFDVDENKNTFEAFAQDLLIIENDALGYKISYLLEEFKMGDGFIYYSGKPKFDEMHTSSTWKQRRWEKNRKKAYNGSLRHFFYSMNMGTLSDEGFKVYRNITNHHRPGLDDIEEVDVDGYNALKKIGYLQITYLNETQDTRYTTYAQASIADPSSSRKHFYNYQTSWLRLNAEERPLTFINGEIDPDAVTVYGYWSWERVAELIPIEYHPDR